MMRVRLILTLFFLGCGVAVPESLAVEYTAGALRDPFSALAPPPEPEKEDSHDNVQGLVEALVLQGVVIGGSEPRAIVNGQVVKVGTRLGMGEVVFISKEGVTLRYHGKDYLKRVEKKGKTK